MKSGTAIGLVLEELERVREAHDAMNSPHEGFAVLQEEVDELWDEVKAGTGAGHRGVSEAVQVAAMALCFLIDLGDEVSAEQHTQKVREFDARPDSSNTYYGYSG